MLTDATHESAYYKIQSIKNYLQDNITAISDFSNTEILIGADKEFALDMIYDIIENMSDNSLTHLYNDITISENNAEYKIDWRQYRQVNEV